MKYIVHEVKEYLCECCEKPLGNHEGWPYFEDDSGNYCFDCALQLGLINANEWLASNYWLGIYDHATYSGGVVTIYKKWGRGYTKDKIELNPARVAC